MPLPVPRFEEFLEDLVDEDAELFRVERRFVFRIFLEAQHPLRKESERALEVPLERADAVGRRLVRRGGAMKAIGRGFGSRGSHAQPCRCVTFNS